MRDSHTFTESEEMYLKTIAEISRQGKLVPVTGIAERLSISTVSASEMVHRLQDRGFVEHTPYKGVRLTTDGRTQAEGILRRHRLWECFLTEHLGLSWTHVHDLACRLEHASTDMLTDALDKYLDLPAICPHGNAVSASRDALDESTLARLSDLDIEQEGIVLFIREEDTGLLAELETLEVRPGSRVRIEEVTAHDGTCSVVVDGETRILGRGAAEHILVELV